LKLKRRSSKVNITDDMKIFIAAIFAGIPNLSLASLMFTDFGGCLNREIAAAKNDTVSFHCHFDSTFCLPGEDFLDASEVAAEGLGPCTCDDDFNSNVYTHGCYDMQNTHAVECSANAEQCPDGWYNLGYRFNSAHTVKEDCGHGDSAFEDQNGGKSTSCGKRCTCNFKYQSRDTTLQVGSTQYGLCYDSVARSSYCSVKAETCAPGETFFGPHSSTLSSGATDCSCSNVHVGGCMEGNTFSHCAVTEDNCKDGQTHLMPRALREIVTGVDCRLCREDFAPVASPVAKPIASPTTAVTADKSKSDDDKSDDDKSKSDDDNSKSDDDKSDDDVSKSDDDDSAVGSLGSSRIQFAFIMILFLFS